MKYLMQTYLFEKVSTFVSGHYGKMKKNSEMCWALCYNKTRAGGLAQLGERLRRMQEVTGSTPAASTS